MTFFRLCIFALLVTVASVLSAQVAQEPIAPAHRAAVARFLKAMRAEELAMEGMKIATRNLQAEDPKFGQYLAEFFEDIRPEQMIEKMLPAYAKYYSQENAEATAVFLESPVGRKMVDTMVTGVRSKAKITLEPSSFTVAERQAIARFEQTTAGRLMGQAQGKINEENGKVFRDWSSQILRAKYNQAFAPMVREIEGKTPDASQSVAAGTKSSGFFGQFGAIVADSARRSQESRTRFQTELQQLGVESILAPQNLVTAAGIAQGKGKVKRFHELLDQLLRTTDDILADTRNRAAALDLPDKIKTEFVKGLDNGMVSAIDETIRFGEIERNLAELFQRTLEFSEARLGRMAYKDSRLLFDNQADIDIYNGLIAQIRVEGEKEDALTKESQERRKRTLQRITGQ